MEMTVEQRELYLFTTGTEPFKSELEQTRANNVGRIKSIVTKAWGAYIYDYCTPGTNPFTDEDVEEVFKRILSDKVKETLGNNFTEYDGHVINAFVAEDTMWYEWTHDNEDNFLQEKENDKGGFTQFMRENETDIKELILMAIRAERY